jgi:hypothetical protein
MMVDLRLDFTQILCTMRVRTYLTHLRDIPLCLNLLLAPKLRRVGQGRLRDLAVISIQAW